MPDLPEILAAYGGTGFVVAPAGFGKTHLIAASLCHATRRQLVLTHTYAGVNALRRKLRFLGVPSGKCRIDTIASWSLRLALSYPAASGWTEKRPASSRWNELYQACSRMLGCGFVRRVIRASYGGVYVDEYQDCSPTQHEIIMNLARDLPCRILGDPLQGIFDFDGEPVDWDREVAGVFERIGELDTPHRWQNAGAPALGEWLREVRGALENQEAIDLAAARAIRLNTVNSDTTQLLIVQGNACRSFRCDRRDSVIAIHKGEPAYKAKCHQLARKLSGMYSSIEEIEGRDLFAFIKKLQLATTDQDRMRHTISLARMAMTGLSGNLPTGTERGERMNIRANTRNPNIAEAGNAYLAKPTSANLAALLLEIRQATGIHVARADLFNRAVGVLRKHSLSPQLTVAEAAEMYQTQFRHRGRPIERRRLVGTTLLVKGLEFDHAIVLDATSLTRKELYVALTRGAKSLTVISSQPTLNPSD